MLCDTREAEEGKEVEVATTDDKGLGAGYGREDDER